MLDSNAKSARNKIWPDRIIWRKKKEHLPRPANFINYCTSSAYKIVQR